MRKYLIVAIAAMTLCSNVGEGSASDWLALYVHDERGFAAGSAAAVYTVYTVALTVGRLGGSVVLGRLGRVRTLRIAGIVPRRRNRLIVVIIPARAVGERLDQPQRVTHAGEARDRLGISDRADVGGLDWDKVQHALGRYRRLPKKK